MITQGANYGNPTSDETICKQVKHIMRIQREQGIPQRYFVGASGDVRVFFGGDWWLYTELEEHIKSYQGWGEE